MWGICWVYEYERYNRNLKKKDINFRVRMQGNKGSCSIGIIPSVTWKPHLICMWG
jgi:hypothetical protein